jgi:hypothetical protein
MPSEVGSPVARRYFPKLRRASMIVSIVCFAVVVIQGAVFIALGKGPWSLVVSMIVLGLLGLENFALAQFTYIETSADGLTYSSLGLFSIQTSWANIESVDIGKGIIARGKVLTLREPGIKFGWLVSLNKGRTIPLDGWAKSDELVQEIRTNVPHLTGI